VDDGPAIAAGVAEQIEEGVGVVVVADVVAEVVVPRADLFLSSNYLRILIPKQYIGKCLSDY
jgi:hypothetical protein